MRREESTTCNFLQLKYVSALVTRCCSTRAPHACRPAAPRLCSWTVRVRFPGADQLLNSNLQTVLPSTAVAVVYSASNVRSEGQKPVWQVWFGEGKGWKPKPPPPLPSTSPSTQTRESVVQGLASASCHVAFLNKTIYSTLYLCAGVKTVWES